MAGEGGAGPEEEVVGVVAEEEDSPAAAVVLEGAAPRQVGDGMNRVFQTKDLKQIEATIAEVESKCTGEIVVQVVPDSQSIYLSPDLHPDRTP